MSRSGGRPPVVAVSGRSGAGKTTLLEQLLPRLSARGLRVVTLKHAHCLAEVDVQGKDTWRHRQAGAVRVVLEARGARAMFERAPGKRATALELAERFGHDADLVLAEGFRSEALARIEVLALGEEAAHSPGAGAGTNGRAWYRAVRAIGTSAGSPPAAGDDPLYEPGALDRLTADLVRLAREEPWLAGGVETKDGPPRAGEHARLRARG